MRPISLAHDLLAVLATCGLMASVACSSPPSGTEDGVGGAGGEVEVAASPVLEIRDAQARIMPAMGAVYLTVINRGAEDDRLTGVESASSVAAETHETVEDDGVMRMRAHPEGFVVPAGGSLELVPGGKHIMLVEPGEPADGEIALTLHFEKGGAIEIEVPAAAMGTSEPPVHSAMDH